METTFLELDTGWRIFRAVVLLAVLGGFASAGWIVYWLLRYVAMGTGSYELDQIPERVRGFLVYVIGQKKVIAEPAGILHLFVFWGFLVLQLETIEYLIRGVWWEFHFSKIVGVPLYNLMLFVQDIMAGIICVALSLLVYRRFILKPKHVVISADAAIIAALIIGLMITKFIA
ncbi:MAG: hypothetical protein AAGI01_18950, partial [Myxococcota bacterium]